MTKRTVLIAAGSVGVLAAVVAAAAAIGAASRPRPAEVRPPEIGGQQAPAAVREIDFARRYDAHCLFFGDTPTVFRGCKVVGFTGPDTQPGGEPRSSFLSSPGSSQRYFHRWLVLELSDGRLAYVPPSALKYLETAKEP